MVLKRRSSKSGNMLISRLFKNLLILLGCVVYAVGVVFFLDPIGLTTGGVTGIAIIIEEYIPFPLGTLIFLINLPLFFLGFRKLGKSFIFYTAFAVAVSSLLMDVMGARFVATDNMLLASILGGAAMGCGIGFVFRGGASTGGTDIVVSLIRNKFSTFKSGELFLIIDGIIVAAFAIINKNIDLAFYALITIVVQSWVLDKILYGPDVAGLVYIISDYSDLLCEKLLNELSTGVTRIQGTGMYTGAQKNLLFLVVHKKSISQLKQIVRANDPNAFVIVSSANEVYGLGYKNTDSRDI